MSLKLRGMCKIGRKLILKSSGVEFPHNVNSEHPDSFGGRVSTTVTFEITFRLSLCCLGISHNLCKIVGERESERERGREREETAFTVNSIVL